MGSSEDWFDGDIAKMDLRYSEKAGLQIYRNYTRSFEDSAIAHFRDSLAREELNVGALERLVGLLVAEDVRFIPVIVCSFGDTAWSLRAILCMSVACMLAMYTVDCFVSCER